MAELIFAGLTGMVAGWLLREWVLRRGREVLLVRRLR